MARVSKKKTVEILDLLRAEYPEAGCALEHVNVFELIVCVVLSAQTTDASVNRVSPDLFAAYPDAAALAAARQEDVIDIIKTIGMYKTKSKNIIALAQALCEKHGGQVPEDYDALVALPGVGRKTANVGNEEKTAQSDLKISAKNAGEKNVLETEKELMKILPNDRWTEAHHSLIWHGRKCCTARNPKCGSCPIEKLCKKNGI